MNPAAPGAAGHFRLLEHTADIGIEVQGESLEGFFEQAALGLLAVLGSGPLTGREERLVEVSGHDVEEVLVNWLNELLYLLEVHAFLPAAFVIGTAGPQGLKARVRGEAYDPEQHPLEREVKAVTYHQLQVEQENGCWRARIFVDL